MSKQASDPGALRQSIDVPFAVPFVHRLRITRDVLGVDSQVLLDLLEAAEGQPARVQFWVDANVAEGQPELHQRIHALCRRNRGRISVVGNIQLVPGGEEIKNDVHILERMLKVFNAHDLDRRSYVVVIGGGAVLDAVGFAAAVAHRGLRLIRLPTTTLGQADSGVGVKNAVNLFQKKNWVGSFAVPWAVINDASLLATLPDRDFRCGFVEAVKVSLLKDPQYFADICASAEQIRARNMEVCLSVIRRSAEWHLQHITRGSDPFEMLEARPLDFGHWLAHKLEAMTNFEVRHGEAVAVGVAVDTIYSSLALGLSTEQADQVIQCLVDLGFKFDCLRLQNSALLFDGLEEFRQHLGGRLTVTMLQGIGQPIDVHEIDLDAMHEAIERIAHDLPQGRRPSTVLDESGRDRSLARFYGSRM
ncbi:MAG: 3-dehydroquinate synthase [Pirellulales bacterium]|nr:3-dehydroquinate synthase [Pirellulales bacterium]